MRALPFLLLASVALAWLPACVRSGGTDPNFAHFDRIVPGRTTMAEVADLVDPPDRHMLLPTRALGIDIDSYGRVEVHAAPHARWLRVWRFRYFEEEGFLPYRVSWNSWISFDEAGRVLGIACTGGDLMLTSAPEAVDPDWQLCHEARVTR